MEISLNIEKWSSKHHPKWLIALRLLLGISLFIKGFQFMQNDTLLTQLLTQSGIVPDSNWISNFIPWAHIFGGLLMFLGFFTRLTALTQIPVLV